MITIQTTITPQQITRSLACDWAPTLRRWAGAVAAPLVVAYTAGLMTGEQWHRLRAWWRRHHLQGLARLGLPGADAPAVTVQRQAPASIAIAPPRVSAIQFMAAGGMSQRQIARQLGISRHRVKAALAA